jgi:hypothetical protein
MKQGRFRTEKDEIGGGPPRRYSRDEASKAVLQAQGVEIEQKPDVIAAHLEIGENLRLMDRQELFDGFDLKKQFLRDDDVRTKARIKSDALIDHRYGDLPRISNPGLLEFEAEAFFVDGLEQSWSQPPMQLDCQPYDLFGQFAAQQHNLPRWPSIYLALLRAEP